MTYDLILIDPPWLYNARRSDRTKFGGGAYKQYPMMSKKELVDFKPVIDGHSNKNCIMFMWATCPRLNIALEIMNEWGFEFKTIPFAWRKVDKNGKPIYGPGYYAGSNAEVVLLGIKGANKGKFRPHKKLTEQYIDAPRREHSRKPEEARIRIEKMYPDLSKIEIFAREQREGWTAWGNEINKFSEAN